MKRSYQRSIILFAILLFCNLEICSVSADEGYITTYNHHIMKGELEVMLMNDYTSPSEHKREEDGHSNYFSQMLELEYAPTSQLALEFMAEAFEDTGTKETEFTGFRYEARYRLFRDEVPLNPMIYAEYEDLHVKTRYKMEVSGWVDPPYEEDDDEPNRERILETRVIFSQDIGAWNLAFNWINETDFHSGVTAFGYSFGLLCNIPRFLTNSASCHEDNTSHVTHTLIRPTAITLELFGALGDTKRFGLWPSRQEHYIQPSIMFHVGKNSMLTIGYGVGLTKASGNIIRTSVGWMF